MFKKLYLLLLIIIVLTGCTSGQEQRLDGTQSGLDNAQNKITIKKTKNSDCFRLGGEKFFDVQYVTQNQDPFVALILDSGVYWVGSSFVYMNNGRGSRGLFLSREEAKHGDYVGFLNGQQASADDYSISVECKQYREKDLVDFLGNEMDIRFTVKAKNKTPGILFCKIILNNVCINCCEPVYMIDGIGVGEDNGIFDTSKKIKVNSVKVVPLYFVEATELNRDGYTFNGEKNECEIPGYFGLVDTINLPNYKDGIVIVSSETYQSKKNTVCIDNNCTMCVDGKADYSALYSESFDIEKPKTEDVKKHSLSVYYIQVQMVEE